MKSQVFLGLFLYWDMEVGVLEVDGGDPFSLLEGGSDGFRSFHFELFCFQKEV